MDINFDIVNNNYSLEISPNMIEGNEFIIIGSNLNKEIIDKEIKKYSTS